MILTYRYRLKDKHAARLNAQARAVNLVWNYCNETQMKAARSGRKWLTGYELGKLVSGATKEGLDLLASTAERVCQEYDQKRCQHKKAWLRWRSRRSLGWVPFRDKNVSLREGSFIYRSERYEVWLHRPLPEGATILRGAFSQDSRGRWYINCAVEVPEATETPVARAGLDLGLKSLATLSTGQKIEMPAFYRKSELKLGKMQRARKTGRIRSIHAKVANRRKDFLHKASSALAAEHGLIVVGDVNPTRLSKTGMAKSIHDAGWSAFKRMLSWKLRLRSGGTLLEVSEKFSSQTCSECGSRPPSRPRGIAGLSKRAWRCDDCGSVHDRDVNAARNILRLGLETLAGGAPRHGE